MEEERKERGKKMAKLIAKVWSDEAFKERLIADPQAVLAAEGISVSSGIDIKVLEQTDKQMYLVIPARPDSISVEDVEKRLAAHASYYSMSV